MAASSSQRVVQLFAEPKVAEFVSVMWRFASTENVKEIPDIDSSFVRNELKSELEGEITGVALLLLLASLDTSCRKPSNGLVVAQNNLVGLLSEAVKANISKHQMTTTFFIRLIQTLVEVKGALKILDPQELAKCFELCALEDKEIPTYASACNATRRLVASLLASKTGTKRLLQVPDIYKHLVSLLSPTYNINRSKKENKHDSAASFMIGNHLSTIQHLSPLLFNQEDFQLADQASQGSLQRFIVALCSACMQGKDKNEATPSFGFAASLMHAGCIESCTRVLADATNTLTTPDGLDVVDYSRVASGSLDSVLRGNRYVHQQKSNPADTTPQQQCTPMALHLYETLSSCILIGTFGCLFKSQHRTPRLPQTMASLSPIGAMWQAVGPAVASLVQELAEAKTKDEKMMESISGFASYVGRWTTGTMSYQLTYHFLYFLNQVANLYIRGKEEIARLKLKEKKTDKLETYVRFILGGISPMDMAGIVYSCYAIMGVGQRNGDSKQNEAIRISSRRSGTDSLPLDLPESASIALLSLINCHVSDMDSDKSTVLEGNEETEDISKSLDFLMQLVCGAGYLNTCSSKCNTTKSSRVNVSQMLDTKTSVKCVTSSRMAVGPDKDESQKIAELEKSNTDLLASGEYSLSITKLIVLFSGLLHPHKHEEEEGSGSNTASGRLQLRPAQPFHIMTRMLKAYNTLRQTRLETLKARQSSRGGAEGNTQQGTRETTARSFCILRKCMATALIVRASVFHHHIRDRKQEVEILPDKLDTVGLEATLTDDIVVSEALFVATMESSNTSLPSPTQGQEEVNSAFSLALAFIVCFPPTFRDLVAKTLLVSLNSSAIAKQGNASTAIDTQGPEENKNALKGSPAQRGPVLSVHLLRTMTHSSFVSKQSQHNGGIRKPTGTTVFGGSQQLGGTTPRINMLALNEGEIEEVASYNFVPFVVLAALALCLGDYMNMSIQERFSGQSVSEPLKTKLQTQLKFSNAMRMHIEFSTSKEIATALESTGYIEGSSRTGMSEMDIYKTKALNYNSVAHGEETTDLISLRSVVGDIAINQVVPVLIALAKRRDPDTPDSPCFYDDITTTACDQLMSFRTLCALALMGASVVCSDSVSDCAVPILAGSPLGTMNQALVSRGMTAKEVQSAKTLVSINEALSAIVFSQWTARARECLSATVLLKIKSGSATKKKDNNCFDLWSPLWNHCFMRQALYQLVRHNTEVHFAPDSSPLLMSPSYKDPSGPSDKEVTSTRDGRYSEHSSSLMAGNRASTRGASKFFCEVFSLFTRDCIIDQCAFIDRDYVENVIMGKQFTPEALEQHMNAELDVMASTESMMVYLTFMRELVRFMSTCAVVVGEDDVVCHVAEHEVATTEVLVYTAYLFSELVGLYGKNNNIANEGQLGMKNATALLASHPATKGGKHPTGSRAFNFNPELYDVIVPLSSSPTKLLHRWTTRQIRNKAVALILESLAECSTFHLSEDMRPAPSATPDPRASILIPNTTGGYNEASFTVTAIDALKDSMSPMSSDAMNIITFIISSYNQDTQSEAPSPKDGDPNQEMKNVFSGCLVPTVLSTMLYIMSGGRLVPSGCQAVSSSIPLFSPDTYSLLMRLFRNTSVHPKHCNRVTELACAPVSELHAALATPFDLQTLSLPTEVSSLLVVGDVVGGVLPFIPSMLAEQMVLEDPDDPETIIPAKVRAANNKHTAETILNLLATSLHNVCTILDKKLRESKVSASKAEGSRRRSHRKDSVGTPMSAGDLGLGGKQAAELSDADRVLLNRAIMYMKLIAVDDIIGACIKASGTSHTMGIAFQTIRDLVQLGVGHNIINATMKEVVGFISTQFNEVRVPNSMVLECSSVLSSLSRSKATRIPLMLNYCGLRKKQQEGDQTSVDLVSDSILLLAKTKACPASLVINLLLFFESVFVFGGAATRIESDFVYHLVSLNLHALLLRKISKGAYTFNGSFDTPASLQQSVAVSQRVALSVGSPSFTEMESINGQVSQGIEDIVIRLLFLMSTYSPEIHNHILSSGASQALGKFIIRTRNTLYERPISCIVQPDYNRDLFIMVGKEVWSI